MPLPGLGQKSYLQWGPKETSFGTFVAPTQKLELISWDVEPDIGVIQDPSLYSKQSRRALYQGGFLVRGTFKVRLNYEGLLELFRGVSGTYTTAALDGTNKDHIFTEGATLNSYSPEISIGDVTTGTVFRLSGCKLVGVKIAGKAGNGTEGMLTAEFTVLAKDFSSGNTPTGSLTFPAILPVLFHQGIIMDDGTTDAAASIRIRSFEMTLDQPHADDRFYLGSVNVDEPLRNDFLTARWKLEQEFITLSQYSAARSFSQITPRLVFRHPTVLGTVSPGSISNVSAPGVFLITRAAGSYTTDGVKPGHCLGFGEGVYFPLGARVLSINGPGTQITMDMPSLASAANQPITFVSTREFEIRSNSANLVDFSAPISDYGIIVSTATIEAFQDPTDASALVARFRSAEAALA